MNETWLVVSRTEKESKALYEKAIKEMRWQIKKLVTRPRLVIEKYDGDKFYFKPSGGIGASSRILSIDYLILDNMKMNEEISSYIEPIVFSKSKPIVIFNLEREMR